MRIKDVMNTRIITVSPDNGVRQAAKLMFDNHVSGLPVIDDEGHLLGILSEGDLICVAAISMRFSVSQDETRAGV